jgi:hypothetical protein
LNHSNEKDVKIFKSGSSRVKKIITSTIVVNLFLLENDLINNTSKAISANLIRNLINGSAVNNPVSSNNPNGSKIIEPCKKMKK